MQSIKKITSFILEKLKNKPFASFSFFLVLLCHLGLMAITHLQPIASHKPLRQKLVVNTHLVPSSTFSLQTKKQNNQKLNSSSNFKTQGNLVSEKKQASKPVQPKKAKQATTTNQLSNEQAKHLLKQLQKSLAEIETKKETAQEKQIVVPQSIKELKSNDYSILADFPEQIALDYHSLLVAFLKDTLQLPAYGTVKVILTLSSKGECKNLEILASDSEVNRFYLEKQLKELEYPSFTKDIPNTSTYSFNLTFCSDQ